jgi:hypothetical protein
LVHFGVAGGANFNFYEGSTMNELVRVGMETLFMTGLEQVFLLPLVNIIDRILGWWYVYQDLIVAR